MDEKVDGQEERQAREAPGQRSMISGKDRSAGELEWKGFGDRGKSMGENIWRRERAGVDEMPGQTVDLPVGSFVYDPK